MKKTTLYLIISLLVFLTACSNQSGYKMGENYHGFTLVEKKFVEEVNAECLLFKHDKSGARLLKIAADDPNKLFNIAFKTAPQNDCGTPHIMEHSVLNGSKNFPVKSPFDILTKGSLNTFLNAMTGSDITTYPVASMNNKDYFNLMHVYLDAVLNPLIYDEPMILKQEGWHHELESEDGDVIYKGVVFNEMKGAYSNPTRELDYQINKILFPDNTYGVSSGGYPSAIPKLTYTDFINFHKKYYHPGNSYILLYGDADLDKELQFIDSEYLSNYELSDEVVEIPLQEPFDTMREAEKPYAVPEGAPVEDQTYLSLSFVAGQSTERALAFTFDVLTEALVNHESAPVRIALQEAGIGKDVRASFEEARQNVFQITVQNANPEDKELFKETVFTAMKKAAEEGFNKEMIEGILNRMEFSLREGNTPQKGMMYLFQSYQSWFFADDPFPGLEFNEPLEAAKKALSENLLENTVNKYLLNNPHALLMVLKPEPGLPAKIIQREKEELMAFQNSLTDAEKEELVAETEALKAHQKREDTPEALATIPMLALSDINPEIEWFDVEEKSVDGVKVLHHNTFTNNILYNNLYFDIRVLPQELIPYARVLSAILSKLNTENYTYGELDNALNIQTGGFRTSLSNYYENHDNESLIPKFVMVTKATSDKADKMFELCSEVLTRAKFDDPERLKEVISRHQSRVDADIKNNGLGYAMSRLRSYYSSSGMYREKTSGLDYYRFITDLSENFDVKSEAIISNLQKTADMLFSKHSLIGAISCLNDDFETYTSGFNLLTVSLNANNVQLKDWKFDLEKKNEGLQTASKVQFVVKGYNYKDLGYEYNGKMKVMNQILSRDWLQKQVRVMGGAYGGFAGISANGDMYFASYRDPNLAETIEIYDNTPEYLDNFEADETMMTRYIIGTIARMDRPMTSSQEGNRAFQYHFEKTTPEWLKAEREAILKTTVEDLKGMKQMLSDVLDQDAICVYGSEQKIEENAALFGELVKITK